MKKFTLIAAVILIFALCLTFSACNKIKFTGIQAQNIALSDANFTIDNVTITKNELNQDIDKDDKDRVYYIGFISSGIEYTYYVSAITGYVVYKTQAFSCDACISNNVNYIGLNAAKVSALDDAKLTGKLVTYTIINLEQGLWAAYELEFIYNGIRYDYEINASDGEIMESKSEVVKTVSLTDDNSTIYIGIDKAKYFALTHTKLTIEDVIFTRTDLGISDQFTVYKIEFTSNGKDYKFEINAATGTIHKYSIDD